MVDEQELTLKRTEMRYGINIDHLITSLLDSHLLKSR